MIDIKTPVVINKVCQYAPPEIDVTINVGDLKVKAWDVGGGFWNIQIVDKLSRSYVVIEISESLWLWGLNILLSNDGNAGNIPPPNLLTYEEAALLLGGKHGIEFRLIP